MPLTDLQQFCADNDEDIRALAESFSDYQPFKGMGVPHLMNWLCQFDPEHWSLAMALAKAIQYYNSACIDNLLRALGKAMLQHIKREAVPLSNVLYVPARGPAESGQDIARRYQNINNLRPRKKQFVDILSLQERLFECKKPMVVFLDDFIGTGEQICDYWNDVVSQLVPEYLPLYLGVVAAYQDGLQKVENESPIRVVCVHSLSSQHQLLGAANTRFDKAQKRVLKEYCSRWGNHPLGFRDMGALVSFFHGTPNNAPSVIRGSKKQRPCRGLLPGWDDL